MHEGGLVVKSPAGDVTILKPPTVTADKLDTPYDLIVLSCKAYDLQAAINGLTPAVGPSTRILPLLNGILHMDILSSRFGAEHILGGLCRIASSLNADGEIVHTGDLESLMFGARDTANEAFALEVEATFAGTGIAFTRSDQIVQEMWEKWVFIATCAGLTTLMRAPIGDIVEAGGTDIAHLMLAECSQLANSCGFPPRATSLETFRKIFTTPNSPITASLFRDLESGGRIEADHLIGDLLDRAVPTERPVVILRVAYTHMKAYEARRRREAWNTV
ncbi:ketopantoate reductase family protein [Rhizobium sp. VS19-DR183]|uniref:ketopantoate reductase family protein n=2 Tax=unclassified Rhizobium TaxID=2613769 RepID=UPI00398C6954